MCVVHERPQPSFKFSVLLFKDVGEASSYKKKFFFFCFVLKAEMEIDLGFSKKTRFDPV